ncbi:MAG: hypothetical protein AAF389_09305 [Gemmatimonadota bacterium]
MSRSRRWFERLRGLAGLGIVGGATGGLVGGLWGLLAPLIGWLGDPWLETFVAMSALGATAGAACAVGFGSLLALLESKASLARLSLSKMALLGAAVGAALPTAFILATSGLVNFVALPVAVATIVATGAGLGAGLSAAMVGLAQRAQREELAVVDDVARLASSE